jgi:hypothetical protein
LAGDVTQVLISVIATTPSEAPSSSCRTAGLEGELNALTGRYPVGDVVFDPWQIEEIEDLTSRLFAV